MKVEADKIGIHVFRLPKVQLRVIGWPRGKVKSGTPEPPVTESYPWLWDNGDVMLWDNGSEVLIKE